MMASSYCGSQPLLPLLWFQDISILSSILLFFGDDKHFRNLYDDILTDPSLCATSRIVICTILSLLQRGFEDGGIDLVML
jgi:hypothetical protein